MSRLDSGNVQAYEQLTSVFDSSSQHQPSSYEAKQKKEHLQKDITFVENGRRLHFRLCANDSELIFEHIQEHNEIVEKMHDVRCYMQEELYYLLPDGREAVEQADGCLLVRHADSADPVSFIPRGSPGLVPMQLIRYLEAESATYYYKDDLCTAREVSFSRYAAPGHQIGKDLQLEKLLMKGIADKIEFSLSGAHLNFKAHGMQASFFKNASPEGVE